MGTLGSKSKDHVILDRLTKRYGDTTAVSEINLTIRQGEFVTFIGPSGSGKTTTLRCIAGLENPTSGAIYVRGKRIDHIPPYKRDMAMVWQEYVLFPHMNVGKNIEFGLKMRKIDKETRKEKVRESLRIVGLKVPPDRPVEQLSGGERQRVGLARALVTRPQVLLLDEPLASLDRNLRVSMQSELKTIHNNLGITFIYVTHNQSEALAMANRIVVMNKGQIEQIGTPQELFESPQTRFIAEFVGDNNVFEGKVISSEQRGNVVVECGGTKYSVLGNKEIPPVGKEVTFIVRADLMKISQADDPNAKSYENALHAKIIGREYVGSIVKFTLESVLGRKVEVIQPVGYYTSGDSVVLGWDSANTHLLPWNA